MNKIKNGPLDLKSSVKETITWICDNIPDFNKYIQIIIRRTPVWTYAVLLIITINYILNCYYTNN